MPEGARVIRWFDRGTEREVGYIALRPVPLVVLQRAFGVAEDDPMVDCFPITTDQLPTLQPLIEHRIDLQRYDYFLEFDAAQVQSPATRMAG